eukprot:1601241-Amphidinium_carterae.2
MATSPSTTGKVQKNRTSHGLAVLDLEATAPADLGQEEQPNLVAPLPIVVETGDDDEDNQDTMAAAVPVSPA